MTIQSRQINEGIRTVVFEAKTNDNTIIGRCIPKNPTEIQSICAGCLIESSFNDSLSVSWKVDNNLQDKIIIEYLKIDVI